MSDRPHSAPALIMGVVNVTPDSFSDGGLWWEPAAAIEHGHELIAGGADLLDIGGESTRPGAQRPSVEEELRRTIPVVRELASSGYPISIDTMRAQVADAALDAGATMVNDVSGGLADPDMVGVVAAADVPFVAMHWRAHAANAGEFANYENVVDEVLDALRQRVDDLGAAGMNPERIILDPGFGFSKDPEHNWTLLAHLPDIVKQTQHRVLVGTSRKRFLGRVRLDHSPDQEPQPPTERDVATAATSLLAAQAGCWGVRVHNVAATRDALAVHARVQMALAVAPGPDASGNGGSR